MTDSCSGRTEGAVYPGHGTHHADRLVSVRVQVAVEPVVGGGGRGRRGARSPADDAPSDVIGPQVLAQPAAAAGRG